MHWRYLKKLLRHKWSVFQAGIRLGVPIWQLIIHDWHKFRPDEWLPYARTFEGKTTIDRQPNPEFAIAWLLHQNRAPHHPEYWVSRSGRIKGPLPMPERYIREMVADWLGASKVYDGKWPRSLESWDWFQKNFEKMALHEHSKERARELLRGWFKPLSY